MIDTHTHLHYSGRLPHEVPGITAEQLVDTMNRRGIDQAVLAIGRVSMDQTILDLTGQTSVHTGDPVTAHMTI